MRRQIEDALSWIKAFLDNHYGSFCREWRLQALLAEATKFMLVFDACPWGLGAVLLINKRQNQFFTSAISAFDEVRYQYRIGDSRGQQAWEALAVLVALRLWRPFWVSTKITLALQGDNVPAPTLALKIKATSGAMKSIAREVALEFSESAIMPMISQHILDLQMPPLINVRENSSPTPSSSCPRPSISQQRRCRLSVAMDTTSCPSARCNGRG